MMKTLITIIALASAGALKAQWIVADPTSHLISQANHLEDVAKYIEMINRQVEQINTLNSQLDQITTYVDRFGDPESLQDITGVEELVSSLKHNGLGENMAQLRKSADGSAALKYTASGLYQAVVNETDAKVKVTRSENNYKQYAAIQDAAANFSTVHDDVQKRRSELKKNLSAITQALQAATTDAETQKLTGVLVAQSAELEAIDREVNSAAYQAILQDIENRNEEGRQSQATLENHAADKQDALEKLKTLVAPDDRSSLKFGVSE